MKTLVQLLAIFGVCLAGCLVLSYRFGGRPTLISGTVIDWNTGAPVPYIDIKVKRLNSSKVLAKTDAKGRFEISAREPRNLYFLFPSDRRYGTLLQMNFGQTVVAYRPANEIRDLVLPAIPATEVSGHVYTSDGEPLSGCVVSAITRIDGKAETQDYLTDEPPVFLDVASALTDALGRYQFDDLGADRYLFLTRCHEPQGGEPNVEFSWEPMIYPQTSSIFHAAETTLLPGEWRDDIDFTLRKRPSYRLRGRVLLSDGSTPKPNVFYVKDIRVFRADRSFTSTWIAQETCGFFGGDGGFECSALSPGTYSFYFEFSRIDRDRPRETAKVTYTVQASSKQPPLIVQLHMAPEPTTSNRTPTVGGFIDIRNICEDVAASTRSVYVAVWGSVYSSLPCYQLAFWGNAKIPLPASTYSISALEASLVPRFHFNLGHEWKIEALLRKHGVQVKVGAGQTIKPQLKVMSTAEIIDLALQSLRSSR